MTLVTRTLSGVPSVSKTTKLVVEPLPLACCVSSKSKAMGVVSPESGVRRNEGMPAPSSFSMPRLEVKMSWPAAVRLLPAPSVSEVSTPYDCCMKLRRSLTVVVAPMVIWLVARVRPPLVPANSSVPSWKGWTYSSPLSSTTLVSRVVLVLVATIGVCFVIEIFVLPQTQPDFAAMGHALLTPGLRRAGMAYVAIGIIGATVVPHNLYLHSALVQSRKLRTTDEHHTRIAIRFNTI